MSCMLGLSSYSKQHVWKRSGAQSDLIGDSVMYERKAPQACRACRRLKRKCTKDWPACSLCIRLNKACDYPESPETRIGLDSGGDISKRLQLLEQLLQVDGQGGQIRSASTDSSASSPFAAFANSTQDFPPSFFLDTDYFTPLNQDALSSTPQPFTQQARAYLGPDREALCHYYFTTVHTWLPIISKKRLLNDVQFPLPANEARDTLLLLCMKLCTEVTPRNGHHPRDSPLYVLVRSYCSSAELSGALSLRLVQSIVLLAAFELGHALYPAGYMTLGRAARLACMMGLHSFKHSQQLYTPPETWTMREEQRRTWWAIFIFDRFANAGTTGLPLSTPEPGLDDLLPTNDNDWDEGRVGCNEPLLTQTLHSASTMGTFARVCQAAHVLGKIQNHLNAKSREQSDVTELLKQALQLNRTVLALDASLDPPDGDQSSTTAASYDPYDSTLTALSMCTLARFLLYGKYGCNEPDATVQGERIALEVEMQSTSLDGIRSLLLKSIPKLCQGIASIAVAGQRQGVGAGTMISPLLATALYYAATEFAWFIREDHEQWMYEGLEETVNTIRLVGGSWRVGDEYLKLLDKGKIPELLQEHRFASSDRSLRSTT